MYFITYFFIINKPAPLDMLLITYVCFFSFFIYRISSNKCLSPNKRSSGVSDKLNVINAPLFKKKKILNILRYCVYKFTIVGETADIDIANLEVK